MHTPPKLKAALAITTCAVAAALLAAHPSGDATAGAGAISGTTFIDYSSNGVKDTQGFGAATSGATVNDDPIGGVTVRAYSAAGALIGTTTSAPDGTYSLAVAASGTVRVEFTTPAGYTQSFNGSTSHTSVQFVTVGDTDVNFGVVKASEYCSDNPDLVTCLEQGPGMVGDPAYVDKPGAFRVPGAFKDPLAVDKTGEVSCCANSMVNDSAIITPFKNIGATFGVGVDHGNYAYYGTYVKRHSPYGPGSDGTNGNHNWVYRVSLKTGATVAWTQLGDATLPPHYKTAPAGWPDYSADGRREDNDTSDVYHSVGRAGLGDVDVSSDDSTLWAVEETQAAPKLWKVDIAANGDAGTKTSYAIPAPTTYKGVTCLGPWHPMAIGMHGSTFLVGGVCSGDESKWLDNDFNFTTSARTQATAFVLSFDTSSGAFTPVLSWKLSYPKAGNDTNNDIVREWYQGNTGLWRNWKDSAGSGLWQPGSSTAKPMLSNIEIFDDGSLAIAMRDRYSDQTQANTLDYESPNSDDSTLEATHIATAEVLRACVVSGSYEIEHNGACGGVTGANRSMLLSNDLASRPNSPLFYLSMFDGHAYTSEGGAASKPRSNVLWTTVFDNDNWAQQGVRAMGPCPDRATNAGNCGPSPSSNGAIIGGIAVPWGGMSWKPPGFGKGNALGDLELVCDAAPVQIGNRVWIDTNKNGVQDPGETPVAGVTVHLYDSTGKLVGTAVTDANGEYYFSTTVSEPAAGNGDNSGGGLVQGKTFTIRFDNPADYASGGPLFGYALTKVKQTSAGSGSQSTSVDSTATFSGNSPMIPVAARAAGENDHSFDVGFIKGKMPQVIPPGGSGGGGGGGGSTGSGSLVAVGNFTWFDWNKNGVQDRGEPPMKGAKVYLLTSSGKRARYPNGKLAPALKTDSHGKYLFDALAPGKYKVKFVLPTWYTVTKRGSGRSTNNSNPRSTGYPHVAITSVFSVNARAAGDTVRFNQRGRVAKFANLTIDAGVVPAPGHTFAG